jgi:hypothetical protein
MFCVVFVFSCILQVLQENSSNSKVGKLTFVKIQLQINFEFMKRVSDCNKIYGVGKVIKNETNILEIYFSYFGPLLCQNCPVIKNRKSVRIWNPFPTWIEISEKEKTCTYSI